MLMTLKSLAAVLIALGCVSPAYYLTPAKPQGNYIPPYVYEIFIVIHFESPIRENGLNIT